MRPFIGVEGARAPHSRARDYLSGLGDEWDRIYRFAVVRDPFSRLVSCWAFARLREGQDPSVDRFRAWVRDGCPLHERHHLDLGECRRVWLHAPQTEWLEDEDGALLVPNLLRFESIAEDWPAVAGVIGANPELPHTNSSEHFATGCYYDAPTRAFVEEQYRSDFALIERLNHGIL